MADIPTIARKRLRLLEVCPNLDADIIMKQAVYVFGVKSTRPVIRLLNLGAITGDKTTGEWTIDAASIDTYLTFSNKKYNRKRQ